MPAPKRTAGHPTTPTTTSASRTPREQYPTLIGLSPRERRRATRIRNRAIQKGEPFTEAELDAMEDAWMATQERDSRREKPKS